MTRALLLATLLILPTFPALAASSSSASSSSSSTSNSTTHSSESHSSTSFSQEDARDALKAGKVMPLTAILEILNKFMLTHETPGKSPWDPPGKGAPATVLDVDLETEDGVLTYRIDLLTAAGTRMQVRLNARTGTFIQIRVGEH